MKIIGWICIFVSSIAGATPSFRTPAKRYGAAYSITANLVRDGVVYAVPLWVRPDQKRSSLDAGQLAFMGWTFKDLRADQVVIAGVPFGPRRFQGSRSDWVQKPEYPKNCCMGVIGKDVLEGYHLRFDPKDPAHIEWTLEEKETSPKRRSGAKAEFEKILRSLFSVESEVVRVGSQRYDLSGVPFEIDFKQPGVRFEGEPLVYRLGRDHSLFSYDFSRPDRDLDVDALGVRDPKSAQRAGFGKGVRVTDLDGVPVSRMSRSEIETLLRGKKGQSLEIGFYRDSSQKQKTKIIFDFEKNEFIQPESIPSPARRD